MADQPTGGTFRVLAGAPHQELDGKAYSKGDVFESPYDLDKMFANKFERLSGPTKVPAARDDMLNFAGQVMDAPLHQRQNAAAASAKGEYAPQPFVDPTPGVVIRSNKMAPREQQHDPDAVFPGEEHKAQQGQEAKAKAAQAAKEEEAPDFGADVSDQFEQAQQVGLEVFKNERGYTVVKEGEPVRKTAFSSKSEVNSWVRKNKKKLQEEQTSTTEEGASEEAAEE
jgi:hypothetical protein